VRSGWAALISSVRGSLSVRRYELATLAAARALRSSYCSLAHGRVLASQVFDADTVAAIERRCAVVYTGQSRISGDTITAVLGAYQRGDARVITALHRMRELATQMAASLERSDLDAVGSMLAEHWEHQRALHPRITTVRIDDIISAARTTGACGWKALGASGGGCVAVIAREESAAEVRAAVAAQEARAASAGGIVTRVVLPAAVVLVALLVIAAVAGVFDSNAAVTVQRSVAAPPPDAQPISVAAHPVTTPLPAHGARRQRSTGESRSAPSSDGGGTPATTTPAAAAPPATASAKTSPEARTTGLRGPAAFTTAAATCSAVP
jgi:hypothetical protein